MNRKRRTMSPNMISVGSSAPRSDPSSDFGSSMRTAAPFSVSSRNIAESAAGRTTSAVVPSVKLTLAFPVAASTVTSVTLPRSTACTNSE
jgi:hypothetical protein